MYDGERALSENRRPHLDPELFDGNAFYAARLAAIAARALFERYIDDP